MDRFVQKIWSKSEKNYRIFSLPDAASELPEEFIRLCPWEAEYVFAVTRRARHGIIEVGRFNGGSLFVMACATANSVPIHSIDLEPQNDGFLQDRLDTFLGPTQVDLIVGDSQHQKYPHVGQVDILFIDGDHTYEGCLADIENWYENLMDHGHLLFHDSYLGTHGVQDAILDFMQDHPELEIVQTPMIGATYWHSAVGSIAHFIKRPHPQPRTPTSISANLTAARSTLDTSAEPSIRSGPKTI